MKLPRVRVSEKQEQAAICDLLRKIGAAVYVLGRPSPNDGRTHRGTGQSAGIPDLYAFLPSRFGQPSIALWIEVKAATGWKLRPEQVDFQVGCIRAHVPHLVGGVDKVIEYLKAGGWLRGAERVAS